MQRRGRVHLRLALVVGLVLLAAGECVAAEPVEGQPTRTVTRGKADGGPRAGLPTLRGTVTDGDDKPIAGATVRFIRKGLSLWSPDPDRWVDPIVVRSDDEGRFEATGLDGETFVFRVEAAGFAPAGGEVDADAETLPVSLKPGHGLVGAVRDEGTRKAVAGAKVLACDTGSWSFGEEACAAATTDDEGSFRFEDLPEGKITCQARAAGRAVSSLLSMESPLADDAEPLRFYLRPGARVSGRVVDGRDRPLPRRSVSFQSQDSSLRVMTRQDEEWPVYSDTDGEFVHHGLPAGQRYTVHVHRIDGGRPASAGPYELKAGRDVEDVEVVLLDAAVVRVRLVTSEEVGIEATELYLREPDRQAGAFGMPGSPVPDKSIDAGEDGRFTIRVFQEGRFDLVFLPAGHGEVERTGVELKAGATIDLGTLVADEGPSIGGRITDPEGEPIAGAEVTASYMINSGVRRRSSTSRNDGEYRLGGLGQGPVLMLQVEAEGYGAENRQGVPTGDLAVDFTLQPNGRIRGVVETADGEVPPGFTVQLHPEATGGMDIAGMMGRMWQQPTSFSNEDGSFELDDVSPGHYTVEVRAAKMAPARRAGVEVASRETTTIEAIVLEEGLAVRGRVVGDADNLPLLGATVEAQEKSGSITSMVQRMTQQGSLAASDEDGRFQIEGLSPGSYNLVVEHPDFAGAIEPVELEAGVEPGDVVVRLRGGGTLTGTVRDESGRPEHEAHIIVFQNMFEMDRAHMATTDFEGGYEIRKIPAGSYQAMRAPGEDGGSMLSLKTKTAVIREGEITVVDFGEKTRITLEGAVRRGNTVVGDATVTFMPSGGSMVTEVKTTRTDAGGRFEIGLDHPGTYRVVVQTGAASVAGFQGTSTIELAVPDETRLTRDIVLQVAGVSGRITNEHGEPLTMATVTAIRDDRTRDLWAQVHAVTDSEGRYALEGLEPGSYRLTAGVEGYRSESVHPVTIDGDRTIDGIDFRLAKGSLLRGVVLDPQGGGVPGAFVFVAPAGTLGTEGVGQAMTDVNGAFAATVPADGGLDVTAIAQGWAPARSFGVVPSPDPDDAGITLRVTAGGRARILVMTGDDRPRSGVQVQLQAEPGFLGSELMLMLNPPAPTDGNGVSLVTSLAAGDYVIAVPGRDDPEPVRISVMADVETPVVLRLE